MTRYDLARHQVWLVAVLMITGCHDIAPAGRAQFDKWVRSGFSHDHPFLYVSRDRPMNDGRMEALVSALDPPFEVNLSKIEHTVDGRVIRFWNYDRSRVMVRSVDSEPRVISTPAHSFVDMLGNAIAWPEADPRTDRWVFASGHRLYAPQLTVDSSGEFFAYGGNYGDLAAEQRDHMPIVVRATKEPETDLAVSRLSGVLDHVYVTEERVYVTAEGIGGSFWEPAHAACEIFRRDRSTLTSERIVDVHVQTPFADFVRIADISPLQDRWLVYIHASMPLQPSAALFVVEKEALEPLPGADPRAFVGFIDPALVERLLHETTRDN